MRIHCHEDKNHPFGTVYDLDTGAPIKGCFFFDDETGEWERYVLDDKGHPQRNAARTQLLTEKGRGRIRFVPKGEEFRPDPAVIVER
jgi:hypothetical protein